MSGPLHLVLFGLLTLLCLVGLRRLAENLSRDTAETSSSTEDAAVPALDRVAFVRLVHLSLWLVGAVLLGLWTLQRASLALWAWTLVGLLLSLPLLASWLWLTRTRAFSLESPPATRSFEAVVNDPQRLFTDKSTSTGSWHGIE